MPHGGQQLELHCRPPSGREPKVVRSGAEQDHPPGDRQLTLSAHVRAGAASAKSRRGHHGSTCAAHREPSVDGCRGGDPGRGRGRPGGARGTADLTGRDARPAHPAHRDPASEPPHWRAVRRLGLIRPRRLGGGDDQHRLRLPPRRGADRALERLHLDADPESGRHRQPTGRLVTARSANDAWAVGVVANASFVTKPLILHWDGHAWKRVASPAPGHGSSLNGVTALSAHNAWAVGSFVAGFSRRLLVEHWNGRAWRVVKTPRLPKDFTDAGLASVSATSARDVWAVGGMSTCGCGPGAPVILHYNGRRGSGAPSLACTTATPSAASTRCRCGVCSWPARPATATVPPTRRYLGSPAGAGR